MKVLPCQYSDWRSLRLVCFSIISREIVIHYFIGIRFKLIVFQINSSNGSFWYLGRVRRIPYLPFCGHLKVMNIVILMHVRPPSHNVNILSRSKAYSLITGTCVDIFNDIMFRESAPPSYTVWLCWFVDWEQQHFRSIHKIIFSKLLFWI